MLYVLYHWATQQVTKSCHRPSSLTVSNVAVGRQHKEQLIAKYEIGSSKLYQYLHCPYLNPRQHTHKVWSGCWVRQRADGQKFLHVTNDTPTESNPDFFLLTNLQKQFNYYNSGGFVRRHGFPFPLKTFGSVCLFPPYAQSGAHQLVAQNIRTALSLYSNTTPGTFEAVGMNWKMRWLDRAPLNWISSLLLHC